MLWLNRTFPRINGNYVADALMVYEIKPIYVNSVFASIDSFFGDESSTEIAIDKNDWSPPPINWLMNPSNF